VIAGWPTDSSCTYIQYRLGVCGLACSHDCHAIRKTYDLNIFISIPVIMDGNKDNLMQIDLSDSSRDTCITGEPDDVILLDSQDDGRLAGLVSRTSMAETPKTTAQFPPPRTLNSEEKKEKLKKKKRRYLANKKLREAAAREREEATSSNTRAAASTTPLIQAGEKRPLPTPSTDEMVLRNPPAPKRLFREAAIGSLTLTVTFSNGEMGQLTVADLNKYKVALEKEIVSVNGKISIRIEGCVFVNGTGVIQCFDSTTLEWIEATTRTILDGSFKVWKEGELPRPAPLKFKSMWCWLEKESKIAPKQFFETLASQNSLDTSRWRLTHAVKGSGGQTLLIEVDEGSLDALECLQFRPFYLMSRIFLQERCDKSRRKAGTRLMGDEGEKKS